tara:strand:- start:207 stop:506 length:300 start_codon:yes stop_codon:yes gene_type:complete
VHFETADYLLVRPASGYGLIPHLPCLSVGDIFTVKAGTATMPYADAAFNLPTSGDYEMVLLTNGGNVMSDYGVIPEPTTLVLTSIIGTGILAARRIFIV